MCWVTSSFWKNAVIAEKKYITLFPLGVYAVKFCVVRISLGFVSFIFRFIYLVGDFTDYIVTGFLAWGDARIITKRGFWTKVIPGFFKEDPCLCLGLFRLVGLVSLG